MGPTGPAGEDGDDGDDGQGPWLVGGGLRIEITDASIDADDVATVTYQLTDGGGTPLDSSGLYTEGAVDERFLLAWLGQDSAGRPRQYTSYLTAMEGGSTQATSETPGATHQPVALDLARGVFSYTFQAAAVVGANAGRTHTVGIYATRELGGERYVANATFDFVPDGSPVDVSRDVVATETCNACHGRLEAHGGSRREVRLCVLCHSPQTTDDETGNTLDFKVMIHKIHAGEDLPSVEDGGAYVLSGYQDREHDYSDVAFPRDLRGCKACHDPDVAADATLYRDRPSSAACGSCHDDVDFATGANHLAGPQTDADCNGANCHSSGSLNADNVHLYPLIDPASPVVEVTIDDVTSTDPGDQPQVDFTVLVNGAPRDIMASGQAMDSLRFTLGGPTSDYDYANYRQAVVQGTGAEGTLSAVSGGADGKFRYLFPPAKAIPLGVEGTFAIGVEGSIRLVPGGTRYATHNDIAYVSVDGSPVVERRTVVDTDGRCNRCHEQLAAHGGSRKDAQYCVLCHAPGNTNDDRWAQWEGSSGVLVPTVDFKVMIHKIHRGDDLEQPYVLGTSAPTAADPDGSSHDFAETRFPGDLRSCGTCHVADTFDLPLPDGVLPSRSEIAMCIEDEGDDADAWCDAGTAGSSGDYWVTDESILTPPVTSVCTACHDGDATAAHAEIMTTQGGAESCETCHGPGSTVDIALFHRRAP